MFMMEPSEAGERAQPKPPASQHQALLEVTESIATHRDLPALFHDLMERLPRLVNFDTLWLVLHEPYPQRHARPHPGNPFPRLHRLC